MRLGKFYLRILIKSKRRAAKKNALVDSSFSLANMKKDYTNNVKEISASGDVNVSPFVKIVGGLSAGLLFNFFLRLGSKHLCPLPL